MNTQTIMKVLGERIRERRLSLGLTIEEVAKRSTTSTNLIKELEWAMLKDIDMQTLHAVAGAVEQSLGELLRDSNFDEVRSEMCGNRPAELRGELHSI